MPVLGEDAAREEIKTIETIFDVEYTEIDKEKLLSVVMDGKISTDVSDETVSFTLSRPVELKNGEIIQNIVFRKPTVIDMEKINSVTPLKVGGDGSTIVDLSAASERARLAASTLSNVPLGIFDRISLKDMRGLKGLFGFFE